MRMQMTVKRLEQARGSGVGCVANQAYQQMTKVSSWDRVVSAVMTKVYVQQLREKNRL